MVRRRASDIETAIGRHTLRTTGITDHLRNGGRIEVAQRMAGRSNAKTTDPYDRCNGAVSLDEMERIGFDLVLQGIARRCLSDIIGSMETPDGWSFVCKLCGKEHEAPEQIAPYWRDAQTLAGIPTRDVTL